MPVEIRFLRIFLGVLCVFCAHFLGRSIARKYKLRTGNSQFMRWVLRTLVTAAGSLWHGGLDTLSVAVVALSTVFGGIGYFFAQRPRKEEEDLTEVIFPKD